MDIFGLFTLVYISLYKPTSYVIIVNVNNKSQDKKPNSDADDKRLTIEIVRQMLTLASTGFGLVAALAWNGLVQEFVNSYIKKYFPVGSGLTSLFIYAILITIIAVAVTLQLSKLLKQLEEAESKSTDKLVIERLAALTKLVNKTSEDKMSSKKT